MQSITPFLWFNDQAEEAMNFYLSVFQDAAALGVVRCGKAGPGPEGSVLVCHFIVKGQELFAMNGGPHYSLSPAFSLAVSCDTQAEIDELWDKLCDGGQPNQCGWLTDKYGLSWQIWPAFMAQMLGGDTPQQTERMMQALWQMQKPDLAELQRAFNGQ